MFLPKEVVSYVFKKNKTFLILIISFLKGWGLIVSRRPCVVLNPVGKISVFNTKALWNSEYSLILNSLFGFYNSYRGYIKFKGMGFKGMRVGYTFIMKLGYSHRVAYLKISGIRLVYENRQAFKLVSRDCLTLKNVVYNFKKLRKMNAYKKKGVYFKGSIFKFKVSTKKAKF